MSIHVRGRQKLSAFLVVLLLYFGAGLQCKRETKAGPLPTSSGLTGIAWAASGVGPLAATENTKQTAESEANAINVWTVEVPWLHTWKPGSPWPRYYPRAAVPASVSAAARSLGYWLKAREVAPQDFAGSFFHAFEAHQPPDILIVTDPDNLEDDTNPHDLIKQITADPKVEGALIEATESLRMSGRPAREFLVVASPNYLAARALALRPPECASSGPWTESSGLSELAVKAATAYLEGDPALKNFEDRERLHTDVLRPAGRRLQAIVPCGAWGNDHLAFVQMTASYIAPKAIGWVRLLMAFRRESDTWSMLAAGTDIVTNSALARGLPALERLIAKLGSSNRAADPPSLLDPQDGEFPVPPQGLQFGDFTWYPSTSDTEVAEVAEFTNGGDSRLVGIYFSGVAPPTEHLSAGRLPTVPGMWKWRVWSISDSGTVSFSEVRSFTE